MVPALRFGQWSGMVSAIEKAIQRMRLFKRLTQTVGDDESFVRLIQVALDDPMLRRQLKTILLLDSFNRQSALNTLIREMKLTRAPRQIITALGCLLDDAVADNALSILQNKS